MLSEKSIKKKFLLQLVVASAALIVIFSILLYSYIKITIFSDVTFEMRKEAEYFAKSSSSSFKQKSISFYNMNRQYANAKVSIAIRVDKGADLSFEQYKANGKNFLILYYPYDIKRSSYIKIEKDITNIYTLLEKILKSIVFISMVTVFLVLFYALFLSEMMLYPITSLNKKLAKMNENFLEHINLKNIPPEYMPLGNSINRLIDRIQHFVKYQKELFIGTAHELKTPLAVMKTKNEVTLIRDRDIQRYKDALKLSNKTIDEMNKMITNILEIGRQESAQFEKPVRLDLIQFLKDKTNDFNLLARHEDKYIKTDFKPDTFCIVIQPTLLIHILQNFVQNAVKFTPVKGTILIKSYAFSDGLHIDVIDEGEGVDEGRDLFAPFKRYGNKSGAGLGLFLAKGAADALGAKVSIKNREDGRGAVASLIITAKNQCGREEAQSKKKVFSRSKRKHATLKNPDIL